MVGWSWVVLAGEMIVRAGAVGSILAFGAGAVMVWLVGLTYAELSAALSRAGGELSFTFVGFGPTGAFVCGWTLVLAYVAVCAFEAVALPTVVSYLAPGGFEVGLPLRGRGLGRARELGGNRGRGLRGGRGGQLLRHPLCGVRAAPRRRQPPPDRPGVLPAGDGAPGTPPTWSPTSPAGRGC